MSYGLLVQKMFVNFAHYNLDCCCENLVITSFNLPLLCKKDYKNYIIFASSALW